MTTDGRLHRSLRNSSASMKTCNQIPAGPANARNKHCASKVIETAERAPSLLGLISVSVSASVSVSVRSSASRSLDRSTRA